MERYPYEMDKYPYEMEIANILDDPARLDSLRSLGLIDAQPEAGFDRLTALAIQVFDAPVALISLVDDSRQLFKGCFGLPEPYATTRETPLSHSFCKHVVQSGKPLILSDTREHDQFKSNLAVRDLGVIAYAGMPLVSSEGHRLGSFCVIDSQPRQWTEEEIRILRCMADCVETEIESKDRLARLSIELQQAAEVAKRKNIFLAQLSHELRNPLSPILNASQMLCEGHFAEGEKLPIYEMLRDQTQQVVRMVNDMLDLSRVEQGKIRIVKKPVDLHSVVKSSINTIHRSAVEQGHSITVQRCDQPLIVLGDFDRLVQIVNNLLTNACRYTPDGGEICVQSELEDGQATIRVTDNGLGIPSNKIDEVFKVFSQVESDEESSQGLGLGLAIAKQLAKLHGGFITAKSDGVDRGSEFQITIPMCDEDALKSAALEADPIPSQPVSDTAQLNILIVEDIYAVAFMFRRLLESSGHTVRVAKDVEQAMALISEDPPEAIFSDIGLPGVNGFDFARELTSDKELNNIPLVAMTGSSRSQDIDRAAAAGFDYFLTKPIDIGDVLDVIEKISESVQSH